MALGEHGGGLGEGFLTAGSSSCTESWRPTAPVCSAPVASCRAESVGLALKPGEAPPGRAFALREDRGHPPDPRRQGHPARHHDRGNLGLAMQGLAVVPLLAGHDPAAPEGGGGAAVSASTSPAAATRSSASTPRRPDRLTPGARWRSRTVPARPGARRPWPRSRRCTTRPTTTDDSATGGPDLTRRIYPLVPVVTEDGSERLAEPGAERLRREMVEQRHARPDGPNATL